MSLPMFNQVALDPTLIKGIYNTCDQWCMYCPATARCLAYRCSPELRSGEQNVFKSLADRLYEGMTFFKRQCEAQGQPTPELDAMLEDDVRKRPVPLVNDPLERAAFRCAQLTSAYLMSRGDYPVQIVWRLTGPTPLEVVEWFHILIATKIYRALSASADIPRGMNNDAPVSAKVALIGIDRSLEALATLSVGDDDARLELLSGHLRRLRGDVEARFPAARAVAREGLD